MSFLNSANSLWDVGTHANDVNFVVYFLYEDNLEDNLSIDFL